MKRVLITNDDGISAPGIEALTSLASRIFEEVWVVAPREQASQIGHRVTTDTPIGIDKRGERRFAVDGTPADCTRAGLHLMGDKRPDWVWSGINHGGNLGHHDYFISGTMAAAREAAFFGIPALGASQYMKAGIDLNWEKAIERLETAFRQLQEKGGDPGVFWNVNLPHLEPEAAEPETIFCEPERAPLDVIFDYDEDISSLIYRGSYHDRSRIKGSDVDICFGGNVAVTRFEV
ncbi:MAG: 5'/3'-nucleotidase SurE [Verrucomicrobiales bacterium]|nr:5'/3'-nucleotidase SurE [Verrucomicrobiales bacterium]